MRCTILVLAALAPLPAKAEPVTDSTAIEMTRPQEQIVSQAIRPAELAQMLKPVEAFYGFWTNGSAKLLADALDPQFTDRTLPHSRLQGIRGPAEAARVFLDAVPDLRVTVLQRLVVGDRVVSHLRFTGHFTGTLMGRRGSGQPIDFIATDILRVRNGKITDNWHIEDNLTFLQQTGMAGAR